MRNTVPTEQEKSLPKGLRTGFIVFAALAGIKVIEYALSRLMPAGNWPYLGILAVASAWLIVVYYKHIGELRRKAKS